MMADARSDDMDAPSSDASRPSGDARSETGAGGSRVPQQGLVLYLHLDDNPPTTALDEVTAMRGMANKCTSVAGKVGGAFDFLGRNVPASGDSSYIQFPDRPALNPTTAITVGAWIKPRTGDPGGSPRVLQKGYSNTDQDTHIVS